MTKRSDNQSDRLFVSVNYFFRSVALSNALHTTKPRPSIHIGLKAVFKLRFYGFFESGSHIERRADFRRLRCFAAVA